MGALGKSPCAPFNVNELPRWPGRRQALERILIAGGAERSAREPRPQRQVGRRCRDGPGQLAPHLVLALAVYRGEVGDRQAVIAQLLPHCAGERMLELCRGHSCRFVNAGWCAPLRSVRVPRAALFEQGVRLVRRRTGHTPI